MSAPDLNPAVVAAIEARLAKATPGPWEAITGYAGADRVPFVRLPRQDGIRIRERADAELIAHAPTDIRLLLDEVARLRVERDEAEAEVERLLSADRDITGLTYGDRAAWQHHLARAEAAEQERDEAVRGRNYAMRQRDEERRAKESNWQALGEWSTRAETAEAQVAAVRALPWLERDGWWSHHTAACSSEDCATCMQIACAHDVLAALAAPTGEGDGS